MTRTTLLLASGHEVVIVSGDKDLAQLLRPGVRQYDLSKYQWCTHGDVPAWIDVQSHQVVDLQALTGDSVDYFPGVRGVGPKAAVALLEVYGTLEAIYADLDGVEALPIRGAAGLRRKLEEGREMAHLCRQLVQLHHEVPCGIEPTQLAYTGADSDILEAFAEQWGLKAVARQVPRR